MTDIALEPDAGLGSPNPLRIAAERRPRGPRRRRAGARRRGAGVQRAGRPRRFGAPAASPSSGELPVRGAHHDRRQRQRRRHAPDRRRTGRRADRRPSRAAGAEGPRPRAARGVVHLGRAGAGLHGRRPVHGPRGARPAGRAAHLRPLGPGDRHPAGPWRASGARAEAGDHLALLQPDPEIDTGRALFRRAVRLQGHPRRRRRAPAAARRRHRMVLRHRAAGARGAQRPADPRGPGGLGGRPGQPRRHRRHRDRRPQGHRPDVARLRRRLDPGEHHCRAAGFIAAGGRTGVAVPPGGPVRRHRRRVDRGLPAAVHADAGVGGRAGGEPDRVAGHGDRQHRRQPALHVRGRRSRQCDPPSRRGPGGVRNRAGDHQRRAGRAARRGRPTAPHGRTRGVGARQSGGHRGALRSPARLGVSPAAGRADSHQRQKESIDDDHLRSAAADNGGAARSATTRPCAGSAPRCWHCSPRPPCCTYGGWVRPAGPTTTTRPRRRQARRTGRRGCSARWTRATRSRSTSRPQRCG